MAAYLTDTFANERGHEVIRAPVRHCEHKGAFTQNKKKTRQ